MKNKKIIISGPVVFFNGVLLIFAGALLIFYIIGINSIAAGNYRVSTLQDELGAVTEENGSLLADKLAMESSPTIKDFAARLGLVEAKSSTHVFENKGVALGNNTTAN